MMTEDRRECTLSGDGQTPMMVALLNESGRLKITPTGTSMYPTLRGGRDEVILEKLRAADGQNSHCRIKRGDILAYRRGNGVYVLHRVYRVRRDGVYMLGDCQTCPEGPLERSCFFARAAVLIRDGKEISLKSSVKWKLFGRLWLFLRPLRPVLLRLKEKMTG